MLRCFFLLCGAVVLSFASTAQQLDSVLTELIKGSRILDKHYFGFALYDLDSNENIYNHNGDKLFTPASNTKTYTLFTAMKHIGDSIPGIRYVEKGDSLIFWGTGDPTFLHEKLDNHRVYDFLKNSGKHLYYAKQENAEGPYRNGWAIEDYRYYYQPDIAAFPIYGNVVRFRTQGGALKALPAHFDHNIHKLSKPGKYFSLVRAQNTNTYVVSGQPKNYRSEKPFIWSDSLFVKLLTDTLGKAVATLADYPIPTNAQTLYSVPKSVVLREMMLPSDNFLAEHLTMVAAYNRIGEFLTDSLRQEVNVNFFSQANDTIQLYDGSGLSSYNKITPNNMIYLLGLLKNQVSDEFALKMFFSAGGVDGTLKNAYQTDRNGPFVWAKTGTLSSVYCQSGYLETREGRRMAFSFLNNNISTSAANVRREVVRIITYLHQNY